MTLFWGFFISVSPAIAILCYFYECDRSRGESYQDKLKAFLMGFACIIPAGFIEGLGAYFFSGNKMSDYFGHMNDMTSTPTFSLPEVLLGGFVLSAMVEESLKLWILLAVFRKSESFKSRINIIMLTVCIGLGFASIENVMYVFTLYSKMGHTIAQARAFMSLPMHAIAALVMGSILAQTTTETKHHKWIAIKALLAAILLHGTYNSLLFMHTWLSGLLVLIGQGLSIFYAIRYFKNLQPHLSTKETSRKSSRTWWQLPSHSPLFWITAVAAVIASSYWIPQSLGQVAGRKSTGYQSFVSNDENAISQVQFKYRNGDYTGVISDCDRILSKNPRNAKAYLYQGLAYYGLNNLERAIESYSRAIEIDSEYALAYYNRAEAYFYQKNYTLALADYDLAIRAKGDLGSKGNKRLADIYANRGDALGRLGRFSEALASADRAIEIDSQYEFAWYIRSLALAYLNRKQEALKAVDTALQFANYAYIWHHRGDLMYELQRYPEAIASYEKAVQIDPQYARSMYSRGLVLAELGRDREALTAYNQALALYPDWQVVKASKQQILNKLKQKGAI
ncbi:tetratricopeptide repeat protein [Pseudanabaena sp. FACHB-1998]|uniref:tetratricopeptide repeat protein n=1 Tax=Pseudanabaena sp. FACHB-1998 TaxID=2692858 RepID=UPI001680AC9F|nr:tetratricopeptide repeat protein [Pseudanabaena sp. FACHB-1998]MBD2179331.1 tetratricopeptide repeat protein [Pseudanabaena sp. FACHB-1998]